MASRIVELLPRHTVYCEPFAGGAAVMFAKPWPPAANNNHYREVLNDADGDLINLYRVVQRVDTFSEFQRLVSLPYSRQVFDEAKALRKSGEGTAVECAAAYWINVSQSFGRRLHGGWGTAVYSRNEQATWLSQVERLPQYLSRLASVASENTDALDCIARWDSPQTLFYCDPPYPSTEQAWNDTYEQVDFAALVDVLAHCEGSFILSCYPNVAADAYANGLGWERFEVDVVCHVSGQGKTRKGRDKTRAATKEELGDRRRTEVLWRVDRSDNARPELQEVWRAWARKGFRWGGDNRSYQGQQSLW